MACASITNIPKNCDNNIGGIVTAYLFDMDDILSITEDTTTTWSVTAISLTASTAKSFIFKKNTSNYDVKSNIDLINGSTFWTATVNLVFHRREASKSKSINILAAGQRYLGAVLQDNNSNFWYVPNLQLTAEEGGSGTARADGSNYKLTFTSELSYEPLEISSALAASLL